MSDSAAYSNNVVNPEGAMIHAKVKLPKAKASGYSGKHPLVNADSHMKLLGYLQQRLRVGKDTRNKSLDRMVQIDRGIAGWMQLSKEDKERQRETHRTGKPLSTEMNLPIAFIHIDDMMTYFAQTFAPTQGMFYQTGKPQEQDQAKQIVTLMNNHAIYAGYFREVLLGLYSILKYNRGGFQVVWSSDLGPKLAKDSNGKDVLGSEVRWQGNRLAALDMYNFFPDPTVHASKLHTDGEFAAQAFTRSKYWLQKKASQGLYFNCEEAFEDTTGTSSWTYYVNPPEQANFSSDQSGGTDWKAILSESQFGSGGANFELVEIYINLNPTEFGLVDASQSKGRDRYEMWKFTVLNNNWIISSEYQNNIHGFLPFFMGMLNDDSMGSSAKSTAEILNPLQVFASSLLNIHVKASRKNLWGTTYYDPTMFDLDQVPDGDVAGRVKMKATAQGRDIRTGIYKEESTLSTEQTMEDLKACIDLLDRFFPTQSAPSQIASIDRAVDSQVAAVQQGANRRQQKAARLLDETIFRAARFAMYYNIIQYQPDQQEVTDFYSGKQVNIDLNALRQTDLPFIIGQGLKAIDRQAAAQSLQRIIFALIQAPQAAQGMDILGMIDFWTSMIDIDIDMTQFRLQQQPGAGAVDPATGQPIVAATSPAAVTGPMLHNRPAPGA